MGVVTVFSISGCPHCIRAKEALTKRGIPFVEINLTLHPGKRAGMLALADSFSVPQIFFNTEHVGGASETIAQLEEWDREAGKHDGAKEKFEDEIRPIPDPIDPRLLPPSEPVDNNWMVEPPRGVKDQIRIPMENSEMVLSVLEVTSRLDKALKRSKVRRRAQSHRNLIAQSEVLTVLKKEFGTSNSEHLMSVLESQKILYPIVKFRSIIQLRLQPYMTPRILNSYRIWPKGDDPVNLDPLAVVRRLTYLFNEITTRSTTSGETDLCAVREDEDYVKFCEACCRLQVIDMATMDPKTRTAFVINTYNLMIRFAQAQLGIAQNSYQRFFYFSDIKIDIGGHLFSFHDLESGILRGNKPPPYSFAKPFGKNDARLSLALDEPDQRIHFALNCGAASCPPVKEFTKEGLEDELRIVSMAYCEKDDNMIFLPMRDTSPGGRAGLPMILQWYREDFAKSKADLPRSVLRFMKGEKKKTLSKMMGVDWIAAREGAGGGQSVGNMEYKYPLDITFLKYDWTSPNLINVLVFDKSNLYPDYFSARSVFN